MTASTRSYVPAAGRDWLLPFYDPIQWLLGGRRLRAAMVEASGLAPGMRVLDVGCGTGDLVVSLAGGERGVSVTGLDPDPLALERARRKLARAAVEASLDRGFADDLPYPNASFQRVFSSFMFHHLDGRTKEGMLRDVHRVLAPDGALHLLDFGGAEEAHGGLARLFHRHDELHGNFGDAIPRLMGEAGFATARRVSSSRTIFGPVAHLEARLGGRKTSSPSA